MIAGDEGKSMTILERISDAPCEPEPYIDYELDHYRAYLAEVRKWPEQIQRGSLEINLDHFIICLENLKRKMHRPTT